MGLLYFITIKSVDPQTYVVNRAGMIKLRSRSWVKQTSLDNYREANNVRMRSSISHYLKQNIVKMYCPFVVRTLPPTLREEDTCIGVGTFKLFYADVCTAMLVWSQHRRPVRPAQQDMSCPSSPIRCCFTSVPLVSLLRNKVYHNWPVT